MGEMLGKRGLETLTDNGASRLGQVCGLPSFRKGRVSILRVTQEITVDRQATRAP